MRAVFLVLGCSLLVACGGGPLHNTRSATGGPDDFSVLPVAPLEIPESLTLPTPTPGAPNLADPDPRGAAIVALGGNPAAARAGGVPAADAALVAHATRNGTTPDIRALLAQEDAAFRGTRGRIGGFNPFARDRYFRAYAGQALDAQAELQRFRNLGVATPSAPPLTAR